VSSPYSGGQAGVIKSFLYFIDEMIHRARYIFINRILFITLKEVFAMKKLILLSILLLVLAVSVSAAFNTVPTNIIKTTAPAPAPISVRTAVLPTVQEDCPTMCKKLISQGMGVFIRCMHDRCKEDCESSCREMYGSQSQKCISEFCMPQIVPKETCEQGCDKDYKTCLEKTVGLNAESIRATCERLRNDCMQKCKPVPETCEQGCGRKLDECLKTTVGMNIESIRSACAKLHSECVQQCKPVPETCEQGCGKEFKLCLEKTVGLNPESIRTACESNHKKCLIECAPKPVSCEGRCELIMGECKANNVDPKSCQMKIDACKRQCKPEEPKCPDYDCEMSCVKEYHGCSEGDCKGRLSYCVDNCFGAEDPQAAVRCRKNCRVDVVDCLGAERPLELCRLNNGLCQQACPPLPPDWVPPSLNCHEECRERWIRCMFDGGDKGVCTLGSGVCHQECPEPLEPGGPIAVAVQPREATPMEKAGLNPQPEPPSAQGKPQDWTGLNPQPEPPSMWERIMGWFGG
jgi:hypothetical protein